MNKPILSLILCSRNDQYMGNSPWRLQTTLNYTAKKICDLHREDDVEIIVTDWGSNTPLHESLHLIPAAQKIVSFLFVPPEIARKFQKDSPFPEVLALNAAVRRSSGRYVGRIDQDTLVGLRFLGYFFEYFEGSRNFGSPLESSLMFANRRSIPYRFAVRCPSFWAVDRYIRWFGNSLPVENHMKHKPKLFYCSYVGIWLLHRDLWFECGGYDERLIYMNEMESDMVARLMKNAHPMVNLGELVDFDFYHLGHYHPKAEYQASANRQVNVKRFHELDEDWSPASIHPNENDWGLQSQPLELFSGVIEEPQRSEFAWAKRMMEWLIFFFLLIITEIQIAGDVIFRLPSLSKKFIDNIFFTWRRRISTIQETISGKPIYNWPRLLKNLWVEKKTERTNRRKRFPMGEKN